MGPEESCDDGNRSDGDGCDARCALESALCGNGQIESGETCDDHGKVDGDGCSRSCQLEAPRPLCGNGELNADEICDDGNDSNSDSCLNGCSRATCGDGQLRRGVEECDRGNDEGGNCSPACLSCGAPGSHYRGANQHCFTVHNEAVNQGEARAICQAEGGDLWTVTSKAESSDVVSKLTLNGAYWLGLSINDTNRSWVTGEAVKYLSFAMGEPKTEARCVSLSAGGAEEVWRSSSCDALLSFVCERSGAFVSLASNHAYTLGTAAASVEQAREQCEQRGGYLATLETADERTFVSNDINVKAWLDATDTDSEGRFVWASGVPVDPAEFRSGQPDDSDGSQACLALDTVNRLSDNRCEETLPFICEFD